MNTSKPFLKPLFIYGTRHGTIFNLTPSNTPSIPAIHLSLGDFIDCEETIKNLPENLSFKKFLGFPQQTVSYLSSYDFYKKQCLAGCQDGKFIKVKCAQGFTKVDAAKFDQIVDLIKPDIAVVMTEYPVVGKQFIQSNKSLKRAILKTTTYYQQSKKFNSQTKTESKTKFFGAIHGGKNLSLLGRSLQFNLNHSAELDGLVVCDVCQNQTLEERQVIYKTILDRLQVEQKLIKKPIKLCLAGLGKPNDIIHALKFGFLMFQINYPFVLAENHEALIYVSQQDEYKVISPQKKQKLSPLCSQCSCQTCKQYSQSYINHLIDCHEMNAKILLSIHNMHVYQKLFEKCQAILKKQ